MLVLAITLLMLGLLVVGMPVGFAMGVAGAAGLYLLGGTRFVFGILDTTPLSTVGVYELVTIPMFLPMAELVLLSGVTEDLFKAAAAWLSRVRGGLAMATSIAGAGFAAICGSSTGSAATLAATTIPSMLKQGYEAKLASGVVAISGTLAILIPPSVGMIVYGFMAEVSIAKLFIAGVIPGLLVVTAIIATIAILVRLNPDAAPQTESVPMGERFRLLVGVLPTLLLFGFVTIAIYSGATTPTEASAVGAAGGLVLALARGQTSFAQYLHAFRRAALTSCMILTIILGAHIFGYFITITRLTQDIIAFVGGLEANRWVILLILLAGYVVMGMFMDQMAILVLTVPIVVPLVSSLGFDLIWFGVIFIIVAEIGLVTPPLGLNCFVVARYAGRPLNEVFHGTFPHVLAHFVVIAILLAFPAITLWLPGRM
ncbi:TRAP transporter large permease [Seohaeicola nanhaiensis]|uniref:TRAP transporter large permease protein n=1 Tax=Seohaeicola nanhaiensis TaxID=1387282 RepID=A0ABV9KLE4_9RHOB